MNTSKSIQDLSCFEKKMTKKCFENNVRNYGVQLEFNLHNITENVFPTLNYHFSYTRTDNGRYICLLP